MSPSAPTCCLSASCGPAGDGLATRSLSKLSKGINLLIYLRSRVVLCWRETAEPLFLPALPISIFITCSVPQGGRMFCNWKFQQRM